MGSASFRGTHDGVCVGGAGRETADIDNMTFKLPEMHRDKLVLLIV